MLRWLWNRLWRAIFQEAVEPATESTTSALSDQASLAPITADPVTPPSGTSIDTTTATAVTSETRAPDPVTPPNILPSSPTSPPALPRFTYPSPDAMRRMVEVHTALQEAAHTALQEAMSMRLGHGDGHVAFEHGIRGPFVPGPPLPVPVVASGEPRETVRSQAAVMMEEEQQQDIDQLLFEAHAGADSSSGPPTNS